MYGWNIKENVNKYNARVDLLIWVAVFAVNFAQIFEEAQR